LRRKAVAIGVAVAGGAGALVLALTSLGLSAARPTLSTHVEPLRLRIDPPDGAADLPLDAHVSVSTSNGQLTSVVVARPSGAALAGQVDTNGQSWQSGEALAPHSFYTVTIAALGPGGVAYRRSAHFSTLRPVGLLDPSILPSDGLTVGVGMPIVIRFKSPVENQALVTSHLTVAMSNPVGGGWHWFTDREVHYRPQQYWPTGEQVTLTASLAGLDAGAGVWGDANHTVRFTIGDARISTVDTVAHTMTVTSNGQTVRTVNQSAGRTQYPTMNGIHFVWFRQQDVLMDSQTVGIPRNSPDGYYEHVFWDVAISLGGEFVHAAPWSLGAQGRSNVSHGCVNLSPADAQWFFNFSRLGDVVQVTGSPRPPTFGDGVADWNTAWDQWVSS
jgi:lipoprotein-anchoring transpeptidase ErfK/SrfK